MALGGGATSDRGQALGAPPILAVVPERTNVFVWAYVCAGNTDAPTEAAKNVNQFVVRAQVVCFTLRVLRGLFVFFFYIFAKTFMPPSAFQYWYECCGWLELINLSFFFFFITDQIYCCCQVFLFIVITVFFIYFNYI